MWKKTITTSLLFLWVKPKIPICKNSIDFNLIYQISSIAFLFFIFLYFKFVWCGVMGYSKSFNFFNQIINLIWTIEF